MVFVANDQTAEVVQPSEEPLDFPSSPITAKWATVLSRATITAIWRNQFDAALLQKPRIELVAVIRLVTDEPSRKIFNPGGVQRLVDEGYLVGRSADHVGGERKTMAVCDRHDLAALSAFGLADFAPPFLAPEKEPSMKASDRSILPRSSKSSANTPRIWANTPARVHCWKRRWQVWYGGYRSGKSFHGAPVRRTHKMPLSKSRGSRGGLPRPPGLRSIGGTNGSINRHCSLVKSMPHRSAPEESRFNHF